MGDLDRALDAVRRRDWDHIRAKWIAELAPIENVAVLPETPLNQLSEIHGAYRALRDQQIAIDRQLRNAIEAFVCEQRAAKPTLQENQLLQTRNRFIENKKRELFGKLGPLHAEIPSIWSQLFPEALRLLHKALHVLGSAEVDVNLGMRSWSLSSAYQAALFAAKALLAFCGVAVVEVESKTLIIDVFPGPAKGPEHYNDCTISLVSLQLKHLDVWSTFQRLLGVTVCNLWPRDAVNKLKIIDTKYFAKQRNDIHYDNRFWPLNDLYDFRTDGPFATIGYWNVSNKDLDFEREDISVVIGYYVFRLVFVLLNDLSSYSNKLAPEVARFRDCSSQPRHPLYYESLPVG